MIISLASEMKMMPLALTLHAPQTVMVSSSPIYLLPTSSLHNRTSFRAFCSSVSPETIHSEGSKAEYKPGNLDHFFLNSFRDKLVKEVGWDSEKPGYDGLIELAKALMMNSRSNSHTKDAAVFQSELFLLPVLLIIYLIGGGCFGHDRFEY